MEAMLGGTAARQELSSGDLLPAGAGDAHGLVLVAVLPVVVTGEAGVAAFLAAHPALAEALRWALVPREGVPCECTVVHNLWKRPLQGLYSVAEFVLLQECLVDALPEALGHFVPALAGDDDAQLGLEVEGLQARHAVVEVLTDLDPPVLGELAV